MATKTLKNEVSEPCTSSNKSSYSILNTLWLHTFQSECRAQLVWDQWGTLNLEFHCFRRCPIESIGSFPMSTTWCAIALQRVFVGCEGQGEVGVNKEPDSFNPKPLLSFYRFQDDGDTNSPQNYMGAPPSHLIKPWQRLLSPLKRPRLLLCSFLWCWPFPNYEVKCI